MSPPRVFSSKLCCYTHFDVVSAFSSPRTRKEPGFVAAAGTRTSTLIAVRSERHGSAMTTVPEALFILVNIKALNKYEPSQKSKSVVVQCHRKNERTLVFSSFKGPFY